MSEMTVLPVRMMWGSADRMDAISTGEADLVFAGPPYFSDETEQFLIKPLSEQIEFDVVYNLLKRDTTALASCYQDIARILKPGRALAIQIKNIKYGDFYIPISGWHLDLAIKSGQTCNRVCLASHDGPRANWCNFWRKKKVRTFRALETEIFYILSHPQGLIRTKFIKLI